MDVVFFVGGVGFLAGIIVGVAASMFIVLAARADKPDGYRPDVPFDNRSY